MFAPVSSPAGRHAKDHSKVSRNAVASQLNRIPEPKPTTVQKMENISRVTQKSDGASEKDANHVTCIGF